MVNQLDKEAWIAYLTKDLETRNLFVPEDILILFVDISQQHFKEIGYSNG